MLIDLCESFCFETFSFVGPRRCFIPLFFYLVFSSSFPIQHLTQLVEKWLRKIWVPDELIRNLALLKEDTVINSLRTVSKSLWSIAKLSVFQLELADNVLSVLIMNGAPVISFNKGFRLFIIHVYLTFFPSNKNMTVYIHTLPKSIIP